MSSQGYGYGRNDGAQVPPPQPAYYPQGQPPPPTYNQYGGYDQQPPAPQQQFGYGEPQQQPPKYNNYDQPAAAATTSVGTEQPKPYDDESEFGSSFSNAAIRRGFIKKVYLILFTQLLFTFGLVSLFIFADPVRDWAQSSMGLWFYLAAYILFIVLYIVLVCIKSVRRKSPGNFICLGAFTLCFSYMAAMISSFHDTNIVLIAMGITALVCLSISIFAIQTKIDFTMCSGFLFVLCIVVMLFGWSCLITYYTWGGSRILNCVYGALIALLFGLFLIYDTQMVVGGRKYELSPEEYIFGALQLYVDVVYLFLIILSFFGGKN